MIPNPVDQFIFFIGGVLLGGFMVFIAMCVFANRLISKMPDYKPRQQRSTDPADYWKYGRANPFVFDEVDEDEEDEDDE